MSSEPYRTVVKRVHPHAWRWQLLGATCALAASLAAGVWWGMQIVPPEDVGLEDGSGLRDRLTQLQLQTEADQQTVNQLRNHLTQQAADIAELEQLLAFYRSVVAPEETDAPVILRQPDLNAAAEQGVWRMAVIVHRGADGEAVFKGDLRLEIRGRGPGEPQIRGLSEVDSEIDSSVFPIRFRYLQQVQVVISLPEGFVPETIESVMTLTAPVKHTARRIDRWEDLAKLDLSS